MFKLKETIKGQNWIVQTWECLLPQCVIRLHYGRKTDQEEVDLTSLFQRILKSHCVSAVNEVPDNAAEEHEYYGSCGRLHFHVVRKRK